MKRKLPEVKLQGNLLYMAGLVIVTLLDFFILHLFTSNQAYNVSDMILSALGFDALHFTTITYDQICLGLGYFVAFLLGGLVLFILLSILNRLFVNFIEHKFSGIYPVIALGIFAVIFAVGFIITYVSKDSLVEMGYTFISTGADVGALWKYFKEINEAVRDRNIAEV